MWVSRYGLGADDLAEAERGDDVAQDQIPAADDKGGQALRPPATSARTSGSNDRSRDHSRLRSLFDISPVAIQVIGPDGHLLDANPAWRRLWGLDPDRFGTYEVRRDGHLAAGVVEAVERAFTGEVTTPTTLPPAAFTSEFGSSPGQSRWLRTTVHPVAGEIQPEVVLLHEDVTDQHHAEEARRSAEDRGARLETLLLQVPVIVNIHRGPDHVFDLVHPLTTRLLGGGDLRGTSMRDALPELEGQRICEVLDRVYATGEPFVGTEVTIQLREADEMDRTSVFDVVVQPIRDATGVVEGVMTSAVDVTQQIVARRRAETLAAELATERDRLGLEVAERRRAEAALEASQERLELAQQAGRIGTFEYDLRSGVVTWSDELEALYGLPPGGFGGRYEHWSHTVHPDDRPDAEAAVGRAIATAGSFEAEFRATRPDGSTRWLAARGQVYPDDTGRPVRLIGINMDVTERRRAEDRLRFLAEASSLLAGSLDYATTLESVARLAVPGMADWCAVDIVSDDGSVERVAVAHVDPEKVALARSLEQRYPSNPDAPYGVPNVLRTGRSEIYPEIDDSMLVATARDAEHLEILRAVGLRSRMVVPLVARGRALGAITLIASESGRTFGQDDLALAEDLARRAAAAVDNARLFGQAQAAVRARDQFLSIAAHELRTPVAGLKGYAQMLLRAQQRGGISPERLTQALRTVNTASDRLATLTDDLLDVSRIRLGQLPLRPVPLDLVALVRDVGSRFGDGLGSAHRLVLDVSPYPVMTTVDAARIEQVLTNLLDNARKYAPEGGEICLSLREGADGHRVELSVQDAGIGLPAGTTEVIFEPFGRAANAAARNLPGLGLGLYICRDIVERHGGRIWAESAGDDRGTTMRIWLPTDTALPHAPPSLDDGDRVAPPS